MTSDRVESAGTSPNTRPLTTATVSVKASTHGSRPMASMRWVKRDTNRVSTPSVAQAKARPKPPATTDRSVLSASS